MHIISKTLKSLEQRLSQRRLLRIASANSDISFQTRCLRYLESDGWEILLVNPSENSIVKRDQMKLVLVFCDHDALDWVTTRKDWSYLRVQYGIPFVLVHRYPIATHIAKMASEDRIALCGYEDLPTLSEKVTALFPRASPPTHLAKPTVTDVPLNRNFSFSGSVDAFDEPSIFRGWVRLKHHGVLVPGLVVSVKLNGRKVGASSPDRPRPDVCGDPHHLAGFTVDCQSRVSRKQIVDGEVSVFASDLTESVYVVPLWQRLVDQLQDVMVSDDKG